MIGAPRVLICDDEPHILRAVTIVLCAAGYETMAAASAEEALDLAALRPAHAAIIDLVLPDGDGVEVCGRLREWSDMPILVLSAIDEEQEKVRALKTGADDYIIKPFSSNELLARLEAALRRGAPQPAEPKVAVGELEVDLSDHTVRDSRGEIHLTAIEFELLRILVRNRDKVLTHQALLTDVWGPAYQTNVPTLRFHIANLRKKLEPAERRERHIRTEIGIGYRFVS